MKLFNNHIYLINTIKYNERKEVLNIAIDNKIKLMYPNLFNKGTYELARVCIDDKCLGGILSGMICCYEISILKNKNYRVLKNVKELKEYIEKAKLRKDIYFIKEDATGFYKLHLSNLSNTDLENEYYRVKRIIELIDSFSTETSDYIDIMIINSIEYDVQNNDINLNVIYEKLNRIVELRNKIDDFLNIDVYIDNENNESTNGKSKEEMISYLLDMNSYFHTKYALLKTIYNNLDNIFNIFNYKLKAEGKVSYGHEVFDNLRKIGYKKLPDNIIGDKDDYISVLNKLLYFLKNDLYNEKRF